MLFNSIDFAIFLPIVFLLYWFVAKGNIKFQNIVLLLASYVFYAWWDWRFLFLILFSTLVDFFVGKGLGENTNPQKRKLLLWTSIIVNLGFLGFFKYYNFFLENFVSAFSFFGAEINPQSLNIILPVGISFYTFQTLSYTIDVYRKKIAPTNDLIAFGTFVSFFPQLVAGPIERASNLLPQFAKNRVFDRHKAVDGLRQILWGLFKKIVIADSSAQLANEIFNNSDSYPGSALFLGVFFFAFQIYGDFSGYSDIAIGTARLFGFDLKQNFAFPYFSRDIAEFWRRWHISLSTWFRDYLYIPLGGSKVGTFKQIRNVLIIFMVSGFWHGANWTYVVWGALNAVYFIPLLILGKNRKNMAIVAQGKLLPGINEFIKIASTFFLTLFAWVFFRAEDIQHAFNFIKGIFSKSIISNPGLPDLRLAVYTTAIIALFILVEWVGRNEKFALSKIGLTWHPPLRYVFYYLIILAIFLCSGKPEEFIYFQF